MFAFMRSNMNNFRTEIKLSPHDRITHRSSVLTVGSCFADHLGEELLSNKFSVSANPLGVTYNPLAIHNALSLAMNQQPLNENLFVLNEDTWKHLSFHSQWSHASRDQLQSSLQKAISDTGRFVTSANVLILTYGTAWTYEHRKTNQVVANCHKLPAVEFEKYLLSPSQIIESFKALHDPLRAINPDLRVILTVSPVRHVRDTLELNQVSKATLRLACHHIAAQFARVEYFPSYEIMMDDLRDYRFYEDDMIHPSAAARAYIFEKFADRYFDSSTRELNDRIASVRKAMAHKPFHPDSPSHQRFLKELLGSLKELNAQIDVKKEIEIVQSQLQ